MIASPCNKVCVMDAENGLCRGCYRTLKEIARWVEMNDPEREEVLRKIQGRRGESSAEKVPQAQCRTVGTRRQSAIGRMPTAEALLRAAAHGEAARALAAVETTGIAKGIYRFSTAEDASRHAEEALARVIVQNVRARQDR